MKSVKKKLLTMMFLLVGASLLLAGCGSQNKKQEQKAGTKNFSYSNEEIAKDLKKGLQDRWKYTDENDDSVSSMTNWKQYGDYVRKCIEKELSLLKKYTKDKKYEDSETKELILSYVDILSNQSEKATDYVSGYIKSAHNYDIYNAKRGIALNKLVKKLDIEFDTASYKEAYKNVIEPYEDNLENRTLVPDAISVEAIQSRKVSYQKQVKLKIKNLTHYSFSMVTIDIREYNKNNEVINDGVVIIENVNSYQTFYDVYATEDNADRIEVMSYSLDGESDDGSNITFDSDIPFSKTITKDL